MLANTFNTMLESLAQTQGELRKAEFFTRSIYSSLNAHVAVIDRHGKIISVNKGWEDFARANGDPDLQSTGIGVNYLDVLRKSATDPDITLLLENLQEVLDGKRDEMAIEYPCQSSTQKHWFLMNVMPMRGAEQGAVISHTDVTELKLAQQALLESEERYRRLVDYYPDMIAVHDKNKFVFINPAGVALLGARSTDEIVGQPVLQIFPPQDREAAKQEMEKSLANRIPTPLLQQTVQRIDGTIFEAEFRAMPILYAGEPAVQIVMRDSTERRRLEEQWQKFKQGIERSSDAMFMTDVDGTIRYVNPAFEKLYGYNEEDAVGNTPRILKSGQTSHEVYQRYWKTLLAGKAVSVQHTNRAKDGRFIDIEGSHNPILDEHGSLIGFLAVHRDVTERKRAQEKIHQLLAQAARHRDELETRVQERTVELSTVNARLQNQLLERKRAEEALRLSEEKYRNIFENVQDVFYTTDSQGQIVTVSPSIEKHTGYLPEEIIGKHVRNFFMDEVDYKKLDSLISTQGVLNDYELAMKRKDGSLIPISVTARIILDEHGYPVSTQGVLRDITERKQAELAMKEAKEDAEESRHAAEEASRGKSEFLSRMSHELRTPMNAILGFAQLLEMSRKEPLTPSQKERVHQIVKGGQHLLELINEILDISRIEANRLQVSPEPVSVRESIQEVVDLTLPLAVERHIQIVTKLGTVDSNPFVMADRQRLKQILLNILGNAVKYNYNDGTVIISCHQTTSNHWRISIADSGPGIPKELQGRLFKPFERLVTDQSGIEGTGLGLALAKRLIELMQGQIGVESMVGKGSTFWIELPHAESPAERLQRLAVTGDLPVISPSARTIVYVEDNIANFELIKQVLADYSQIELLWAPDFKSGIETARQRRPDLILLDVHLGGEDGAEVLRQLQQQTETAGTPVIIVSADATPRQAERLLSLGAYAYLTKPLNVKSFIRLVEVLLREKEA